MSANEYSVRAGTKELYVLEKQLVRRLKKNTGMTDRIRLLNNSLDVYFSNFESKSIHEKMSLSVLKQISDLRHYLENFEIKEQQIDTKNEYDIALNIRNSFTWLYSIENFIKNRNFAEEKIDNSNDDKSLVELNKFSKGNSFKFYATDQGFDRKDTIDDIDKNFFGLIFNEIKQVINEIELDIRNMHNQFPNTLKLLVRYNKVITVYEDCNVVSLWAIGNRMKKSFEIESANCEADTEITAASFDAFYGLNGALISCFKEGKAMLEAADRFSSMNQTRTSEATDAVAKIINALAKSSNGFVTKNVASDASEIGKTSVFTKDNASSYFVGREFSTGVIATVGLFIMKSAASGSIGNATYDSIKLLELSVDFLAKNNNVLKIIFSEFPNSSGWIKYVFETYLPQIEDKKS